jgi:hypothetical protein
MAFSMARRAARLVIGSTIAIGALTVAMVGSAYAGTSAPVPGGGTAARAATPLRVAGQRIAGNAANVIQPKDCNSNGFTDTPSVWYGHQVPRGQLTCAYGLTASQFGGPGLWQLWVVGTDGHVYETWLNSGAPGSAFGPWTSLGGIARSPIDVVDLGSWVDILVTGTNGLTYEKNYNFNIPSGWWPSQTDWSCVC